MGRLGSLNTKKPLVAVAVVLVCSGCHKALARLVQASTTTVALVAQETVKLNPAGCTPKLVSVLVKMVGFGSVHNAVGMPPPHLFQPVVPGR